MKEIKRILAPGYLLPKLSEPTRLECERLTMLQYLCDSVVKGNYVFLQPLYEIANIKNADLLNCLHKERCIALSPKNTIFYDIAHLIYERSESNKAILSCFCDMLKNKYPKLYKKANQIADSGKPCSVECIQGQNRTEQSCSFFFHFHLNSDFRFDSSKYISDLNVIYLLSDRLNDNTFVFDSGDPIFDSIHFKRYIEKRKEALIEAVNEEFEINIKSYPQLVDFLGETLRCHRTQDNIPQSKYYDGLVSNLAMNQMLNANGSILWYEQVTCSPSQLLEGGLSYRPNIDELIVNYYKSVIKKEYTKFFQENHEQMTSFYLARKCTPYTAVSDLRAIIFSYNLEIFYKLFEDTLEQYYRYFSWEQLTHKSQEQRYENLIRDLEKEVQDRETRISSLIEKSREFEACLIKEKKAETVPYEKKISQLSSSLEKKDEEIARLKALIESKDFYIDILESDEDSSDEYEIDLEKLKNNRYLFVGAASEALPQLRKDFPNSIFMENRNVSLQGIKVDAIVMLIKYMSHTMFYKVNSLNALDGIPRIYCNTKSIASIYTQIAKII